MGFETEDWEETYMPLPLYIEDTLVGHIKYIVKATEHADIIADFTDGKKSKPVPLKVAVQRWTFILWGGATVVTNKWNNSLKGLDVSYYVYRKDIPQVTIDPSMRYIGESMRSLECFGSLGLRPMMVSTPTTPETVKLMKDPTKNRSDWDKLSDMFPEARKGTQTCPEKSCDVAYDVWYDVIHLNDEHEWTREQIADWLETLDIDLTFPTEGENNEHQD